MLYLDGRQGLSEFVLRCLKLSGWGKSPTDGWRIGNRHKKESGRQTDDTGENYNGGKDNRMQKAEREIRDKTSGGKEQESLTRRK